MKKNFYFSDMANGIREGKFPDDKILKVCTANLRAFIFLIILLITFFLLSAMYIVYWK